MRVNSCIFGSCHRAWPQSPILAGWEEGPKMSAKPLVVRGIVKGGVVVPSGDAPLPEGAEVEIVLHSPEVPAEFQAEFKAWERASDEAWRLIDRLEHEEAP